MSTPLCPNKSERVSLLTPAARSLRHTAASYLVMGGATLHEAAEILGHKSTETTKRYAHLSTQHKSEVAGRIMGKVFK